MTIQLPVELHILILLQLPGRDPASLTTVISYLSATPVTRAAALDRAVWQRLYSARYTHSIPAKESERRARLGTDWHALFIERFQLDRSALDLVHFVRTHPLPADRKAPASRLVSNEMSFDVWDALELESQLPIPYIFCAPTEKDDGKEGLGGVPDNALPRRFWAKTALGVIARNWAMAAWCEGHQPDTRSSIFELLSALSAFADVSPFQVRTHLAVCQADLTHRLCRLQCS